MQEKLRFISSKVKELLKSLRAAVLELAVEQPQPTPQPQPTIGTANDHVTLRLPPGNSPWTGTCPKAVPVPDHDSAAVLAHRLSLCLQCLVPLPITA